MAGTRLKFVGSHRALLLMAALALPAASALAEPAAPQVVVDAGVLLDATRDSADRLAAADALAATGAVALPFLLAAARLEGGDSGERGVAVAAVSAMASVDDPAVVRYAGAVLGAELEGPVRLAAVSALVATGLPEAGALLWDAAADRAIPRAVRRAAADAVTAHFPAVVDERGAPGVVSDPVGLVAGVAANGLAGGILLSSVGVWGRNDSAASIGGAGGTAIGLGTGALYAAREPVSAGQGLRYASGVSWGLSFGLMAEPVLGTDSLSGTAPSDLAALYRSVGVSAGAAIGLLGREAPAVHDVLEVDLSGYLGAQVGAGIGDWVALIDRRYHARWRGAALGGATGLAVGALSRDAWAPDRWDLGFGGTVAAETAWISGWLPTALRIEEPDGNIRVGLHGGMAAGLAAAHFVPGLAERAPLVGWGGLTGNALGLGIPLVAGVGDEAVLSWSMLPAGAAAAALGGALSPAMTISGGDLSMIGVGTGLAAMEALAVGEVLHIRRTDSRWDSDRTAGLVLTAGAAGGLGLTALSQAAEPRAGDMLFLGASAAWGAWYGALTPIGLGLDGGDDELLVTTTATADTFLLLGGLALLPPLELDPGRTVLAQLGGVGGATLGALGTAMVSASSKDVVMGAVVGSAVGLAGGGLATALIGPRDRGVALLPAPGGRLSLPGRWSVSLLPTPAAGGALRWTAGISATGL